VIGVDSNILVYAHRSDSPFHDVASRCVRSLAESPAGWMIPWPCLHEFLGIVTHARIYNPPSTVAQACAQVEAWLSSPSLSLLGETADHWLRLRRLLTKGRVVGPRVHDARIAAICIEQGVRELWSADRDFSRFPTLSTRNPLLD